MRIQAFRAPRAACGPSAERRDTLRLKPQGVGFSGVRGKTLAGAEAHIHCDLKAALKGRSSTLASRAALRALSLPARRRRYA